MMRHRFHLLFLAFLLAPALLLPAGCTAPDRQRAKEAELENLRRQQGEMAQELQNVRQELARLRTEPGTTPTPAPAPPAAQDEASLYREALFAFSETRYAAAADGFRRFLQAYPGSAHQTGARYWLGLSQAEQGETAPAIATFELLVLEAPQSSRIPAALARLTELYRSAQKPDRASETLVILKTRYPDSPETRRAEKSLSAPAKTSAEGKP